MSSDNEIFSREELLGGLPTRQASTLLFAIESRTAYLMQQSRLAAIRYQVEKTAEQEEETFLEALSQGREITVSLTIQDIERYAPQWETLIPEDNIGIRAALAHLIGNKYIFTYQNVPFLRKNLQLDEVAVQEAYQDNYQQSLASIYAPQISMREQIRWGWSNIARGLENLPPFWTAFSLTVTETVGATILALPIALAKVGVVGGLVLLVILGLANVLTLAALVEAITRNGNMRYGNAYFGRLVGDYLGNMGTLILTIALLALIALVLVAYYVGISTTLEDATGISATIWIAVVFLIGIYFLKGDALNSTIASAMLISTVNISIILILVMLTLPHVKLEYLQYSNVPFIDGQPFDASIIELIFGVIFAAYFGHISAGNAAKVVLRRDPSGQALMRGNVMALLVVIGLYCLWAFALGASIAPDVLAATSGTSLSPLAEVIGPIALILGSIFVVLGMGMASIHFSLALFNQIHEWLPALKKSGEEDNGHQTRGLLRSEKGQFLIGILPIGGIFLLVEWLFLSNKESFSGILGFIGVIAVPIISGIFPLLMLAASRHKSEYIPGIVFRFLGNPLILICTYLLFWASVALHGIIIWQEPVLRLLALVVSIIMLAVTFIAIRKGAFTKRTVVQIRIDQNAGEKMFFSTVADGKLLAVDMLLNYENEQETIRAAIGDIPRPAKLTSAVFQLPILPTPELKIWVHKITAEGYSVNLPASVSIQNGGENYHLNEFNKEVIIPLKEDVPSRVEIQF